jgi:hypothetical protein
MIRKSGNRFSEKIMLLNMQSSDRFNLGNYVLVARKARKVG